MDENVLEHKQKLHFSVKYQLSKHYNPYKRENMNLSDKNMHYLNNKTMFSTVKSSPSACQNKLSLWEIESSVLMH